MNPDLIGFRGDPTQPPPRIQPLAVALDGFTMPAKRRKRRPSLRTLIEQAQKAGLTVTAIRPDGTLIIGKPGELKTDANEWDEVLPSKGTLQ